MRTGPTRAFFDGWSRFYDLPLVQAATYRPVHNAIIRALGRGVSGRILDVGCGTGQLAARLALETRVTRVLGIDFSAGMLARAAQRLRATADGDVAVSLVRADAARIPLRSGSVDAVVSTEAFHWFPDQDACLRELHRVLTPGGQLLLALVSPRFALVGEGVELATRLAGQPLHWPRPAELRARVEAAGFRVERQRHVFRIPGFLLPPLLTEARRA